MGSLFVEGYADDALPEPEHSLWKYVNTLHLSGMKKWRWNGLSVWLDRHSDKNVHPLKNEKYDALLKLSLQFSKFADLGASG